MRRVILAVTGTIAGLVALLSFKTHPAITSTTALPSAALPSASESTAAPTPTPTASGARPQPSSASSTSTTKDYTGQAIETRYGTVQVKITMQGKTIADVSFVQLTSFDGRSEQINAQAGPVLLQQTLSAQSANIDGVSGATYTSQGYEQSLQSALDQVGH